MSEKPYWWMKLKPDNLSTAKNEEVEKKISEISESLIEFLEKENNLENKDNSETDIPSIIEEINKIAAQSPLGPFENDTDRSIEDIIKEAEKIYFDSSRSFELLSSRSKNLDSHSVSDKESSISVSTSKHTSPLPSDDVCSERNSPHSSHNAEKMLPKSEFTANQDSSKSSVKRITQETQVNEKEKIGQNIIAEDPVDRHHNEDMVAKNYKETFFIHEETKENEEKLCNEGALQSPPEEKQPIEIKQNITNEHQKIPSSIQKHDVINTEHDKSSQMNIKLEKVLEQLKDTAELNTSLKIQLENINIAHNNLKSNYDTLLLSKETLERRVSCAEDLLIKYKNELQSLRKNHDGLIENELNLKRQLETERLENRSLKSQLEKGSKSIQDLNRQIKEMERIISRKHPDSISALIVASKNDPIESSSTTRKLLEDRIRSLETEVSKRDNQSSSLFMEVQEKFNQMKAKYESHIEDLELHVSDLKNQLKHKADSYDVYTQTFFDEQRIPEKETKSVEVQTNSKGPINNFQKIGTVKRVEKHTEYREEKHLLATIRGLQTDLLNKERAIFKLNKEIEELKRTNRRLQKEREGSLKSLVEKREVKSYPENLALQTKSHHSPKENLLEEELRNIKNERDKLRQHLYRMEEDYQNLKDKRLQDLTTLQEAHEREISTYLSNLAPLQEQLEVEQVTISSLQNQLKCTKEELAVVLVERDHLRFRLNNNNMESLNIGYHCGDGDKADSTRSNTMTLLERTHIEREQRLRAIILGLAQKNVMNINCEQCAARQKQLIIYKNELDQLMITLRSLN